MKYFFSSLFATLLALSLHAQSEHLKFMGIPLDGKIGAFNKELQKKGFTLDDFAGKRLEGTYIYNGIFAGDRAQVFVNYDEKSKIVYQAAAIIKCYSKEQAINKYKDMYDMLDEKYSQDEGVQKFENISKKLKESHGEEIDGEALTSFEWKMKTIENGYEATRFILPNIGKGIRGDIMVFVSESFSNITYSTDYNLYIKYTDWQNDESQRDNRKDDL